MLDVLCARPGPATRTSAATATGTTAWKNGFIGHSPPRVADHTSAAILYPLKVGFHRLSDPHRYHGRSHSEGSRDEKPLVAAQAETGDDRQRVAALFEFEVVGTAGQTAHRKAAIFRRCGTGDNLASAARVLEDVHANAAERALVERINDPPA